MRRNFSFGIAQVKYLGSLILSLPQWMTRAFQNGWQNVKKSLLKIQATLERSGVIRGVIVNPSKAEKFLDLMGGHLKEPWKRRKLEKVYHPFMSAGLKKEGINFSAILTLLAIICIPFVWFKWLDVSLLRPKKPVYELIITPIPSVNASKAFLSVPGGSVSFGDGARPGTPTPLMIVLITATPVIDTEEQKFITSMRATYAVLKNITPTATGEPITRQPGVYNPTVPGREITAKLSYYWPPLAVEKGGKFLINCGTDRGVSDCEHMANGQGWRPYVGRTVACPVEFEFGTIFRINGDFYACRDRGGEIITISPGLIWLDVLDDKMPYDMAWGEQVGVEYWLPE